jgi:hypothetical protein
MTKTIMDTPFAHMYNLKEAAAETNKWIIQNRSLLDATQDRYLAIMTGMTPFVKTPISECFDAIKAGKLLDNIFYMSFINNSKVSIPEVLTVTEFSIYGKHVKGVSSADLKKTWLNLSSMLAPPSKSRYDNLSISASNEAMSAIVRAMLCMAYADSKEWLSPKAAAFVIEVYAMTMASLLDRVYKLDVQESAVAKFAFAYYYASLLSEDKHKDGTPVLLQKMFYLFKGMSISFDQLGEKMKHLVGKEQMSVKHVVSFIVAHGPSRMSDLNMETVYRSLSISSYSSISSMIAVDLPPYFTHLLFNSLSGNKHPIINNIVANILSPSYVKDNVLGLLKHKKLYAGVN